MPPEIKKDKTLKSPASDAPPKAGESSSADDIKADQIVEPLELDSDDAQDSKKNKLTPNPTRK